MRGLVQRVMYLRVGSSKYSVLALGFERGALRRLGGRCRPGVSRPIFAFCSPKSQVGIFARVNALISMATKTKAVVRRTPVGVEVIQRRIYLVRGQKVMTDADLAKLYQVETKDLNRAVLRNLKRFPDDFMFRLTPEEAESLRCQIGTSKVGRGGRRYAPFVFTEHGVVMLSSVLKSERSVQMNILVVRAFVNLREMLASHKDLAHKMIDLETTAESSMGNSYRWCIRW